MKPTFFQLKHPRTTDIVLHFLFWIGATLFLTLFYGHSQENYNSTFIFVCLLLPLVVTTTYFINYYLLNYYFTQQYVRFTLYFLYTLVISVYLEFLVAVLFFIYLANYNMANMNALTVDVMFLTAGMYFVVFLAATVKLLRRSFRIREEMNRLEAEKMKADLKLKESELKLLKTQLHPHFLFNMLNTMYGLAQEESPKLPDAILRLSQMLDFLLYKGDRETILLHQEVELIQSYIELEQLRFEDRLQLEMELPETIPAINIAPLVFFTFVENAFKHGFARSTGKLFLQISISIHPQNTVRLFVKNSISASQIDTDQQSGGIGLNSVKKRMELLYPDKHNLSISQAKGCYEAELNLTLPDNELV